MQLDDCSHNPSPLTMQAKADQSFISATPGGDTASPSLAYRIVTCHHANQRHGSAFHCQSQLSSTHEMNEIYILVIYHSTVESVDPILIRLVMGYSPLSCAAPVYSNGACEGTCQHCPTCLHTSQCLWNLLIFAVVSLDSHHIVKVIRFVLPIVIIIMMMV